MGVRGPFPVFDRPLVPKGGCAVRQHQEAVAQVLVDLAADGRIHLVLAGANRGDVARRQGRSKSRSATYTQN